MLYCISHHCFMYLIGNRFETGALVAGASPLRSPLGARPSTAPSTYFIDFRRFTLQFLLTGGPKVPFSPLRTLVVTWDHEQAGEQEEWHGCVRGGLAAEEEVQRYRHHVQVAQPAMVSVTRSPSKTSLRTLLSPQSLTARVSDREPTTRSWRSSTTRTRRRTRRRAGST